MTADAVARRAAMSASKLSKIENGKVLANVTDVDLVLTALGVSEAAKADFLAAAREAATEATAWRVLRRTGAWKRQRAIQAIEGQTTVLRLFQGQLVPGLLQTPEYVSAVFGLPPVLPEEARVRTMGARLARQAVLYEAGRSFHFVVCEHVLRWLVCEPVVMALQLDRLLAVSRLPNVSLGVLPLAARMPDFPMTCFSLFDDRLVLVETFHAEVATRDPQDVRLYRDVFERFDAAAVYGEDMRALVESIRDGFLRGRESTWS
jgi:hypothetical protein